MPPEACQVLTRFLICIVTCATGCPQSAECTTNRTSAITGDGIQDLLDILDYQADLLELKGDFTGNAEGTVIEAQVEEGRGSEKKTGARCGSIGLAVQWVNSTAS